MPKKIDFAKILQELRRFYKERRRAPSFDEIRKLFGYKSKNAAFWLIKQLEAKGLVKKDTNGKLLMDSLLGIKVWGTVQAGFPSPAEEELVDTLSLDDYLIRHPEQSFLLKVSGDSMKDAGIHAEDLVIVERGRKPKEKDIVIAQVDGDWTMKYYHETSSGVVLRAANIKYPPIKAKNELTIGGVIVAVVRKYR